MGAACVGLGATKDDKHAAPVKSSHRLVAACMVDADADAQRTVSCGCLLSVDGIGIAVCDECNRRTVRSLTRVWLGGMVCWMMMGRVIVVLFKMMCDWYVSGLCD